MSPERFHNPYTFIPTPPRNARVLSDPFLGDHDPSDPQWHEDHSRYWSDRYTGVLHLKVTCVTPLFIPKTPEVSEDAHGHKTYDCADAIPATSVKGMLRSAYEAITNSRYGVLEKHDKRLGMRLPAEATLVPGRVRLDATGNTGCIELFMGFSIPSRTGLPVDDDPDSAGRGRDNLQYAAWIPSYYNGHRPPLAGCRNGAYTGALLVKCQHFNARGNADFVFWRVHSLFPSDQEYHGSSVPSSETRTSGNRWNYVLENGEIVQAEAYGYIVKSGKMIENKHDERMFFNGLSEEKAALNATTVDNYNDLLLDYHRAHKTTSFDPPRGCEFGAHIAKDEKEPSTLKDGDFVYVKVAPNPRSRQPGQPQFIAEALYPVMISRHLNKNPPMDFLDPTLRPATQTKDLSPADRLFGWVNQEGKGAWRAKVRFGTPTPADGTHVEGFDHPCPLAILGAPKPSQFRFYLGGSSGEPQPDGLEKVTASYIDPNKKHLRGRKVYWHHKGVAAHTQYWQSPWVDRTGQEVNGYRQEYRQPSVPGGNTDQNRSIKGWFPVGSTFRITLTVENLTPEELGALLTLTDLPGGVHLRMGYGKPLGLGSVRLELDNTSGTPAMDVWLPGGAENGRYATLNTTVAPAVTTDQLKRACKAAYLRAYGRDWGQVSFVAAFLRAGEGPDNYPVQYPRLEDDRTISRGGQREVNPSFKWFVDNEAAGGKHRCLPSATDANGLERLVRPPRDGHQQGGAGGGYHPGNQPRRPNNR